MIEYLSAIAILLAAGVLAWLVGKFGRLACVIGPLGVVGGCGLACYQAAAVLFWKQPDQPMILHQAWSVPLGSLNMELDPLSAIFTLVIGVVCSLAAIYGGQYLLPYAKQKNLGVSWFFFNLLVAGMLLVLVARNGVFFLFAWEIMSLAPFFLIMFDSEKTSVRRAGWTYLVAAHLGAIFLIALFVVLGRNNDSLDFDKISITRGVADLAFVLAVIGFGTKAGFIPLHIWLPEAHPAAPSHVSAVMSGVMIKMGIYGLLRMLILLGEPPAWWGWTFVGIGVISGVFGVLYALAQHDLKRLLAYCSVENVGIITIGLGVGLLGVSYHNPVMATLGFAGGLLHMVNHALFKSLLFLGAGAVLHAAETLHIDHLGGLFKRMPTTGFAFLLGATAICGLPPLNGFVSEFLIYFGAVNGLMGLSESSVMPGTILGIVVLGSLSLMGGLAVVCFAKAFGMSFLGEPRSEQAAHAHEAGVAMRVPMLLLAGLCAGLGLAAPLVPRFLGSTIIDLSSGVVAESAISNFGGSSTLLLSLVLGCYILLGFIVLLAFVRRMLLSGRKVESSVTWDCGYAAPTPRMQYTGSSFSQSAAYLFRFILHPREILRLPQGLFPQKSIMHTETPDVFGSYIYRPIFRGVTWLASKLRWLQQGRIQLYVLYIALTALALLIWKLG
jgi:formate hydrogenlyase subunit 3/multisubunit Na+/H+ antiporter MnhD subunit